MISIATSLTIWGLLKAGLRRAFLPLLRSVSPLALLGLFAAIASASEPGTALVRQAPQMNGRVEGSVHQMLPQSTTLNGGAAITGHLLVPGTPTVRLNGQPSFGGTTDAQGSASPSGYQITLNGNASLGRLVRRVDPLALPSVSAPPAPSGTRNVTINNSGQSVGVWSTVRNLTLNGNGGSVTVPSGTYGDFTANGNSGFVLGTVGATQPSVYHFQRLTLNGQSTFTVVGPIIVTVANGFSANGTLGSTAKPEWLTLRIASGGLTLNGGSALHGHVIVPSGTVTINGNSRLVGGLVADRLVVNGNGLLSLLVVSTGNQAPVAQPQAVSLDEDVPHLITLVGNDPEGASLTYRIVAAPLHGTAVHQAPGSAAALYRPAPDYFGPDHFTFVVNDGAADSPPATISITVRPVNDRPVADGKTVELDEDTTVLVTPTGTDAEGATLAFGVAAQPAHGTVTLADGRFTYQPALNYHGPDRFTYVASDGDLSSTPAAVEITVRPVNDPPRAFAQQVSVSERGTISVTLAGEDDDGDALVYRVVQSPARGELTGSAPDLVYTAPANPTEPAESFSFVVNDGHGDSAPAIVSVTVILVNDPPAAHPKTLRTDEDTPVAFTLTGEDPEGSPLDYIISQDPASGTLSGVAPDLVYAPSADWSGTDEFSFTVNDGDLPSASVKVTITVDPVNDRPVADGKTVELDEDTTVLVTPTGTDAEGTTLAFAVAGQPAHGTVTLAEGRFTYQPALNYHGPDRFTYVASDGDLSSEPAAVEITVRPVNDPPRALAQQVSVSERGTISVTLAGEDDDGDALVYRVVQSPVRGELTGSAPDLVYAAPANPTEPAESFTFVVNDGHGDSAPAIVSVTVILVNDSPAAHPKTLRTDEDTPVAFTLTGEDPEGLPLTFAISQDPASGTLSGVAPDLVYAPSADWSGTDEFSFTVNDGDLPSASVKVTITVDPVNDRPVADEKTVELDEDTTVLVTPTGTDAEGTTLAFGVAGQPAHGTVTLADGRFTYQPALNYHGPDRFTYVASDGDLSSEPAAVEITVRPVNDPPRAFAQQVSVSERGTISVTLAGEDDDGDALVYRVVQSPARGELTGSAPDLVYAAPANPTEPAESFTFVVNDGQGDSAPAIVSVTVILVNDPPAAHPKTLRTDEDTPVAFTLTGEDPEGSPLDYIISQDPASGTLSGVAPDLVYAPSADWSGTDEFSFTVNDGELTSAPAKVTITVDPVNDRPVASSQSVAAGWNTSTSIILSAVDVDLPTGAALTYGIASLPAKGRLYTAEGLLLTAPTSGLQSSTLTYTADIHAAGDDSFTFVASDGEATSVPATVSVSLSPPPPPPVITFQAPTNLGEPVNTTSLRLLGTVVGAPPFQLAVNGVSVPLAADHSFDRVHSLPIEGANSLVIVATDVLNRKTTLTYTIDRITQAPALEVGHPSADGFTTRLPSFQVAGTVGPGATALLVNGAPVADFSSGAFSHPLLLSAGNNLLIVEVRDALGNTRSLRRTVVLDQTPPSFTGLTPVAGFLTRHASLTVSGRVLNGQSLTINGTPVTLAADGAFSHGVVLAEGAAEITLEATDAAGNVLVQSLAGVLDSIAPVLSLDAPVSGSTLASASVGVTGSVDDPGATLTLNAAPLANTSGTFAASFPLTATETTLTVTATDAAGNTSTKTATVRRDLTPPVIAYTAPAPGSATRAATVRVTGTIDDSSATVAINGRAAAVSSGRFEIPDFALTEGTNTLSAVATDPLGNSSAPITLTLTADRTPPAAPSLVAPPAYIKADRFTLQGAAEPGAVVSITGGLTPVSVTADAAGSFSALILLTPNQASDLLLRATDAVGNESAPVVHRVVPDTLAPVITVSRPADGAGFDTSSIEVVGTVADANLPAVLQIAGQPVPLTPAGAFAARLTLPDGVAQPLVISVVDLAGNPAQLTRTVTIADAAGDDDAPVIVVLSPAYGAVVPSAEIAVTALVSDESTLSSVTLGGVAVSPDASGRVAGTVTVDANGEFSLVATDANNLTATLTHRVQVNGLAPVAPTIQRVSPEGVTSASSVLLYASALAGLRYEITGGLLPMQSGTVAADGKFVATVPLTANAANALQVRVVGSSGLASSPATVEVVHDSLAPVVTHTTPAAGATDAASGAPIQIVFNEPLRAAELAAIEVRAAGALVGSARALSADARTLTLTPAAAFAESVNIQVTLPATLADLAGNALGTAYSFGFRTADVTAPAAPVLAAAPARVNRLALTLSGTAEPLARVEVAGAASPVSVLADAQGRFALGATLVADSVNTLSVIALDAAGNASAPATLAIAHDATALVLQESLPADAATGVALDTALRLTFNKAIDPASLAGVTLVSSGNLVAGVVVTVAEGVVSLAPAAALVSGKPYEIVVPATVADLFGNRLGVTRRIAFSTGADAGPAPPVIYTASPVGASPLLVATLTGFSTPGTRLVIDGGASSFEFPADGVIDTTGLFTVTVPLQADAQNTLVFRARDAGGRLSAAVSALSVRQDSIIPTVLGVTPAGGALAVPVQTSVFVEFSEAIQTGSLSATVPSIRLFDALNAVAPGSWIAAADGRSATFYPARPLAAETRYNLLVSTSVRDLAGNPLAAPFSAEFTTAAAAQAARPATPVLDPLASPRTTAASVTLSGSAPAGAEVRVFGGQGGGTTTADAQGRFSVTVTLVPAAANPLAVVAVVGGILSDPATVTVTQVRHAAALRILSPQTGVQYHNRSVTVAGVIDDPDAVSAITITGSGIDAPGLPATIVGRYFFRQVVLDEAAGAKSLSAVATVKSGGSPLEASVTFSLQIEPAGGDTHAPIPRFIFPEDGDVLNGEVVEALLTVEEGVQLTHVEIADVVAHDVVGNIFLIHAKLANQGANTLTVNATDAAGHVGSSSVNVVMDSIGFASAPVVAARPSLTAGRTITLTGTAEPGATIVVLNGLVPVRTVVAPDGTYSVVVPLNPNSANELQVVATDAAGNLSPVTTVHIEHDDTAPTIVSTSPSSGQAGVPVNAAIEVRFSEAIAPASVTPASAVVLRSAQGQTIQRNALLSADGKTLRIVPSYKLLRGDTITVELDAAIADVHGFLLGADHVFTFTTAAYQTTVSGIVVDPQLRPLANVRVGIAGSGLSQTTSSFGTFLLDDAPVGDQLLTIDARPDTQTGLSPQGDARVFGYLEFLVPVRRDVDNSLGRPIFMVDTDFSTATPLAASGGDVALTFTPVQKDLGGFSVTYTGGSGRFADGSARGSLTATRIDAAHIPDRLPSGAIPHFLVELGPDDLVFATPARLTFPNVYDLPVGEEVILFHFKYGVHDYTELGRATVGADGRIVTGPILQETGFVGIVPASGSYDLTRGYLQGRVVDAAGQGLAGISVNAIAGTTYAVTDADGRYSIPLPDVRLELIRAFATVSTDLGARDGESPSLVFQSELVALQPSGVTLVPDIVVDSFFLGGGIRYRDTDGDRMPVTGLAYDGSGHLVSIDLPTARAVEILVYRRHGPATGPWTYDSEPYMRTTADLDPFDDTYDSSFSLSFLGSLAATGSGDPQARIPAPGDVVKLVAFDRATGFYGEADLKIPAAAEADGGDTPLDVLVNLELRPPQVRLDMNRVFFLDGIRRRANIPHRGIAFTGDEYIEFKTTWATPVAIPLDRAELALSGRLRVTSIGYQTDHPFTVRGGEHARVLELREGIYANRLAVLQRETDVGIEFVSVSPDGSFASASLVPIEVTTTAYGLAQASATVAESVSQNVELHILQLALSADEDGVNVSGRTLPGGLVNVGGTAFTADGNGYFGSRITGALGTGGLPVQVGSSLATRFGESLAPVLNALDATPPGLVPARGSQGDVIVLHGAHFSPVADDNKVSFNGAAAVVQSASESALTVEVPELASSGDVTVTVAGKRSNAVRFDFLSVGINNGSFEDGTLRAFTLEGSGRVVERWKRLTPTDRQYMAFLDTMADPRDGLSTLTSDAFEVPEGMQTLLFDYNFVATTLLRPVHEVLELQILTESQTIVVGDLFAGLGLDIHSTISGFDRGSGFRTASVLVNPWAGTGQRIRLRVVLKGRGVLPAFIPGMDQFDANPLGLGKNAGTGVFLDHFRLSAGFQPVLPPLDRTRLTLISNGTAATLSAPAGFMPTGSRVYAWNVQTGLVLDVDVGADGGFVLSMPFASRVLSATYLISYAAPAGVGEVGRVYGPSIKLRVNR